MYEARIVIADNDPWFRKVLKDLLRQTDYLLIGEVSDAASALQTIFQTEPEVVIVDPFLPGGEGIDLTSIIDEHRIAPIVAIADPGIRSLEEYANLPGVYGIILKPLIESSLEPVIESALANFKRLMKSEKELIALRRDLENRKIIEKAKGLLMDKNTLSEKDAYKMMQRISMDKCIPLAKVARTIILRYGQQ
ncbi:MAG: ANTAR domain-containing protein [Peptococcaceae bacterium]|nr:ANTAR domain-containing protein [Peptococcaceae bacterium]